MLTTVSAVSLVTFGIAFQLILQKHLVVVHTGLEMEKEMEEPLALHLIFLPSSCQI